MADDKSAVDAKPENGIPAALARTTSRLSNSPSVIPVPRSARRGLLANLCLVPEIPNPTHYAHPTKWFITFTVALSAAAAPMGSAVIMPALSDVAEALNTTPTITNLSVALYMLSMSIFPLWWSSFSETLGRRTIYIVSFIWFTVFAVLSAVSQNIAMLIAMRVLSGGGSASVQAVGAGTIADIWEPKERGTAMGIFYLGPLCGPLIAPIIGGALAEGLGWRSTQWFLVVYGGLVTIFLIFAIPETLRRRKSVLKEAENEAVEDLHKTEAAADDGNTDLQRTTTRQTVHLKTKKYLAFARRCFLDPLRIVLLLRFPAIALTIYYAAIAFGTLYFLNISIEATFSAPPYNFSTIIVGLLYIPNSLGYLVASLFGGRWIDRIMRREAAKAGRYDENGKLIFRPEDRMRENAWIAGAMFPLALVWYGWSAQEGVLWICPMVANFFFGLGSMIIFATATTMLTEFMPRKASSGIAANNFVRNIFSCVGGIVAEPLLNTLGNGWILTIFAIWSLVSGALVIWAMRKYSKKWRKSLEEALAEDED
ncbi:MFS general substrate transporter [Aulographum hederae CBS 113979]|uniref:MFS general substrate transporter n=1 Tax=Aulographum hederae CBS 113979 TaxID=1176131 RepID=A0A6G1H3I0_9PEZI|nr:MFS general substrate transporter [Aulographum hederae CBS 113979]